MIIEHKLKLKIFNKTKNYKNENKKNLLGKINEMIDK